jgi:hypothetical protein
MYAQGRGVPRDDAEAATWYWLAAQQGFAAAMLDLADLYEAGRGQPKNLVCAYFWKGFAAIGWDFAAEQRDQLGPKLSATELAEARRLIQAAEYVDDEVKHPVCPGEPISISLSNSALLDSVRVLRSLTGLEVDLKAVPKATEVRLSAQLKDTAWEEAFAQLFKSGGLRWVREGNVIKIVPLADR